MKKILGKLYILKKWKVYYCEKYYFFSVSLKYQLVILLDINNYFVGFCKLLNYFYYKKYEQLFKIVLIFYRIYCFIVFCYVICMMNEIEIICFEIIMLFNQIMLLYNIYYEIFMLSYVVVYVVKYVYELNI